MINSISTLKNVGKTKQKIQKKKPNKTVKSCFRKGKKETERKQKGLPLETEYPNKLCNP